LLANIPPDRFRADALAFLDRHAATKASGGDFATAYEQRRIDARTFLARARAWQATLADHRWAGIDWPAAHGGRGATRLEAEVFAELQAGYGVSVAPFRVGLSMVGPTLLSHGSDDQRSRFLPPLLRGEEIWCQLFSEPGAGSDLASLTTRAVPGDGGWRITGQKVWTSGAGDADWGIALARTGEAGGRHRGISYFVVDMHAAGVTIRPIRQMNESSRFAEVFLDEVWVPDADVVGGIGDGWSIARHTLLSERQMMGEGVTAVTARDLAAELGDEARARPALRQRLAAVVAQEMVSDLLASRLRATHHRGEPAGAMPNLLKLRMADDAKQTSALALEAQGPYGMMAGAAARSHGTWHIAFLTAPSLRIAGGSDEIQRNIVAERVLGLPRDPRPSTTPTEEPPS
jgi:alkylation response protein AidB-like acyl-CoA dehydrogenase